MIHPVEKVMEVQVELTVLYQEMNLCQSVVEDQLLLTVQILLMQTNVVALKILKLEIREH